MFKICRVDIKRSKKIFKKIDEYKKELIEKFNPKYIILFGSFAKNDFNEGSDIDILVVANFKENFLDRIGTLLKLNKFNIPIEPVGYTVEEFKEMKKRKNSFILEVLKTGKFLHKAD